MKVLLFYTSIEVGGQIQVLNAIVVVSCNLVHHIGFFPIIQGTGFIEAPQFKFYVFRYSWLLSQPPVLGLYTLYLSNLFSVYC